VAFPRKDVGRCGASVRPQTRRGPPGAFALPAAPGVFSGPRRQYTTQGLVVGSASSEVSWNTGSPTTRVGPVGGGVSPGTIGIGSIGSVSALPAMVKAVAPRAEPSWVAATNT